MAIKTFFRIRAPLPLSRAPANKASDYKHVLTGSLLILDQSYTQTQDLTDRKDGVLSLFHQLTTKAAKLEF